MLRPFSYFQCPHEILPRALKGIVSISKGPLAIFENLQRMGEMQDTWIHACPNCRTEKTMSSRNTLGEVAVIPSSTLYWSPKKEIGDFPPELVEYMHLPLFPKPIEIFFKG